MPASQPQRKFDGKLVVFNNIPECLKLWSPHKNQLLKDFNDAIESYLDNTHEMKRPLLIFTFSDPNEITK